jgi:hypothetical protein
VREWWRLSPDEAVDLGSPNGVVAVDGEREIELTGRTPVSVRLRRDGPRCIDVGAVLAESAREGVLREDISNLSASGDQMITSLGGIR